MADAPYNFTTGPCTLPDVGELSYNGVRFSPLFQSSVSGSAAKDNAGRTVKFMEYSLEADGYVTVPNGATAIAPTMDSLHSLLSAQGGQLIYTGRGFDLVINSSNVIVGVQGGMAEVAWGPIPEVLEFQPLGSGLGAKVRWRVTVRVVKPPIVAPSRLGGLESGQSSTYLLQFNYETNMSYGEDGYSTLSIRGTMEIPLRRPTQATRTLTRTADDFRSEVQRRIFATLDLARFRVTQRNFDVSRDKRTLEFSVSLEEKPYMDLPPFCSVARGNYSVRPSKAGPGLCMWLCTLRATYTVAAPYMRRTAWYAFLQLLRLRMLYSYQGNIPPPDSLQGQNPSVRGFVQTSLSVVTFGLSDSIVQSGNVGETYDSIERGVRSPPPNRPPNALLLDLSFDEGLYLDSKTTTFSATWRLLTTFSHILLASGLWRKLPENTNSGNAWATSMRNVSGANSWLPNTLNPDADVIVDFGGG